MTKPTSRDSYRQLFRGVEILTLKSKYIFFIIICGKDYRLMCEQPSRPERYQNIEYKFISSNM